MWITFPLFEIYRTSYPRCSRMISLSTIMVHMCTVLNVTKQYTKVYSDDHAQLQVLFNFDYVVSERAPSLCVCIGGCIYMSVYWWTHIYTCVCIWVYLGVIYWL